MLVPFNCRHITLLTCTCKKHTPDQAHTLKCQGVWHFITCRRNAFTNSSTCTANLNGTNMLKGALEKLEHLRQDITHEFGTNLSKTWKNKFNKDNAGLWLSVDATKKKKNSACFLLRLILTVKLNILFFRCEM